MVVVVVMMMMVMRSFHDIPPLSHATLANAPPGLHTSLGRPISHVLQEVRLTHSLNQLGVLTVACLSHVLHCVWNPDA